MRIEIINGDGDEKSKILPKFNPLASLIQAGIQREQRFPAAKLPWWNWKEKREEQGMKKSIGQ